MAPSDSIEPFTDIALPNRVRDRTDIVPATVVESETLQSLPTRKFRATDALEFKSTLSNVHFPLADL